MGDVMGEIMGKPFDLLLGRRTYDIFAGYWPNAVDDAGCQATQRRHQVRRVRQPPEPRVGPR